MQLIRCACLLLLGLPALASPTATEVDGVVLDPAGDPIAGARVQAVPEARSLGMAAVSDGSGGFSFRLPAGRYQLQVTTDGFRAEVRTVDVAPGAVKQSIEIILQLEEHREIVTITESAGYQAVAAVSTKVPVRLLDTPQAISVVSGEQIRDQSMQNMADVVRYIPGITMAQGEGHRDAPVIRGNVTTSDFFVDGFRDDVQYLRDLYNVERVEAVKGANALTFGRGGGGGILNRVTKSASLFPIREIAVQAGTFGNRRFTADLGHSFRDKLGLRLNGMYENSRSFRHDYRLERYGLSPSLLYQASAHTQIRLRYERFGNDLTTDRGIPSFQGRPSPAHRSTFFGDPGLSFNNTTVNLGSAAIEHQRGVWNFRNTTLAGDYDKFYQNILPGALDSTGTLVRLTGYNSGAVRRNLFNQTDVTGTVFTGPLRHTLLVGAEFGRQRSDNLRHTAYFAGGATSIQVPFAAPNLSVDAVFRQSASDADNRPVTRIAAAFVQDQIEVSRHVQVVAGLRYDRFDMSFLNRRNDSTFGRADDLVSPRLGLVVKPVDQVSFYGSYSVAYLPSSGEQFASLNATTQTLKPEKFNNYEGGVKWDITRRLAFTSAVYRLDRTNTTAPDSNVAGRLVQTGSQRTNGIEVSLNGSVTSRWSVVGGYAYQDAFISSRTTAAMPGQRVAIVPENSFSLWNHVRLLPRLSAGLGVIHQDEMFAGLDNTVTLPSFTRLDAALFYQLTEQVRLQANAENLTNANYFPTAHNNNNILPGSPLALRVGLVFAF